MNLWMRRTAAFTQSRLFDACWQTPIALNTKNPATRMALPGFGLCGRERLQVGAAPENGELLAVDEHGCVGIGAEVCWQLVFLGT